MRGGQGSHQQFRVVFFGTPQFAVPSLAALLEHPRFDVVLVVTQPDRPSGRHRRLTPPPVKMYAAAHDLNVYQPESLRSPAQRVPLVEARADLFVVAAFGLIFGAKTLAMPRLGCVNVHASLLPKYRGAAPIAAAILAGERETGISLMRMTRGLDTGPVIAMRNEPIRDNDTTESLTARLATVGGELLTGQLLALAEGRLTPQPQSDVGASVVRPLLKADGWLDWSRPATELARQVRAMWPWPRAWTTSGDRLMQVHAATVETNSPAAPPGTVIASDRALVACGAGALRLDWVQLAGGKPQTGIAIVRGRQLPVGSRLGTTGRPAAPPPLITPLHEPNEVNRTRENG